MRRLGRRMGLGIFGLGVVLALLWMFGPRPTVDPTIRFSGELDAAMLDSYFAAAESKFDDITPGAEKRVVWAGAEGARTDIAIVYVHGFSATSEEIRPVPDNVATALGANLVYTRLTGHGRPGAALAQATAGDWLNDTAEALAAGRAVGDKVLVLSTSTGGTLTALAALDPDLSKNVQAIVFVSPNFAINNSMGPVLTWPFVRWWGPLLGGKERGFDPISDAHGKFWTSRYPSVAALPLAALTKYARSQDYRSASTPALFIYSKADAVVSPAETDKVIAVWGGPSEVALQDLPPGNDPYNHVIAGDILSPGMTQPVSDLIIDWATDVLEN